VNNYTNFGTIPQNVELFHFVSVFLDTAQYPRGPTQCGTVKAADPENVEKSFFPDGAVMAYNPYVKNKCKYFYRS
jgi:hypothetical protein